MIFVFPQGIDPYPMYWLIDRSVNRFVKQTIFRFNRNEIIGLFLRINPFSVSIPVKYLARITSIIPS